MKTCSVVLLMVLFTLFALAPDTTASYRFALAIGNGSYASRPLSDPLNDVQLMYDTLQSLGFEVTGYRDVNQQELRELIRDFGKKLRDRKDSVGVFYYSGHGMQVKGRNYMIPVGVPIESEADVEIYGVDVNEILTRMDYAGNVINFLFLDACRNNPFEKSFKSIDQGLGRMDAPKGTIIAYAAQPNKVASQGPGKYSYFTEALAHEIVRSGISSRDMLLDVRKAVHDKTSGKQLPVVEDQALEKFYFVSAVTRPLPPPQQPEYSPQARKLPAVHPPRRTEYSPPVLESNEVARDGTFIAYANGVVLDSKTGLEWVAGPDRDMSWDKAKSWVRALHVTIYGRIWRMPTIEELKTLYKKGAGTRNMTPLLKTTGWGVWSGETKDSLYAWYFMFDRGEKSLFAHPAESRLRAFAVCSRTSQAGYSPPGRGSNEVARDGTLIAYINGVVLDSKTGLEWVTGPDRDMTWDEAKSWVESVNIDGGGWRMPTVEELQTISKEGAGFPSMSQLFRTTGMFVWSGETRDSSSAWHVFYSSVRGEKGWGWRRNSQEYRAFAVRSRSGG